MNRQRKRLPREDTDELGEHRDDYTLNMQYSLSIKEEG